jgi:hypothetical protein
MAEVTLTAYNVKTKEKNVPVLDAVITKTAKGAYMPNKAGKQKIRCMHALFSQMVWITVCAAMINIEKSPDNRGTFIWVSTN